MFNIFRKKTKEQPTQVRYYEAGQTDRYNETHWKNASNADANSLISADLATVRDRCRYEIRNNTYASGIIHTLAHDVVGTGPSVEFVGQKDQDKKRRLGEGFIRWSKNCDFLRRLTLAEMLILDIIALCEAGNALTVPQFGPDGVKLLQVESDRLRNPWDKINDERFYEGIEKDSFGRPIKYHISRQHPGASFYTADIDSFDVIDAARIIHLYRVDRPAQLIGMPWITPALPLFAQLRDFTAAVLKAAKRAASISAITKQTAVEAMPDAISDADDFMELEIPNDAMLFMPYGRDISQFKAEQPAATYEMFKREIINEIARCLHMPYGVAACNSSKYNYASGQLDQLPYFRAIEIIRGWLTSHKIERLASLYLRYEVPTELLTGIDLDNINIRCHWKRREHSDPVKAANSTKISLESGQTTLAEVAAAQGMSYQQLIDQKLDIEEYEKQQREARGLPAATPAKPDTEPIEDDDDDEDNDKSQKDE